MPPTRLLPDLTLRTSTSAPEPEASTGPSQTRNVMTPMQESIVASSRKRKSTTSTSQPNISKRIKKEETSSPETENKNPVVTSSDYLYDSIVNFHIGEEATNFGVHRGLLRLSSAFFREELAAPTTAENAVKTQIIMKEEDPAIFRHFHTWLYTKKIFSEPETYKNLVWKVIIDVYTFAERTGIPRLQNTCVDTAIKKIGQGGLFPGQHEVNSLWECSGRVFQMRRLLLDLFATKCNLGKATSSNTSYHPRFLQGLVHTLYDMKTERTIYDKVDFWAKRRSYYVENVDNPILLD